MSESYSYSFSYSNSSPSSYSEDYDYSVDSDADFDEYEFRDAFRSAMAHARRVLGTERRAAQASEIPHEYTDKFTLAEQMTTCALAAFIADLDNLGVTEDALQRMHDWNRNGKAVTLRFDHNRSCTFVKKTTKKVEGDDYLESSRLFGLLKTTHKVVTSVDEYEYAIKHCVLISAFGGDNTKKSIEIKNYEVNSTVTTIDTEEPPFPDSEVFLALDLDMTYFMNCLGKRKHPHLEPCRIDRSSKDCRTPRRNPQIDDAVEFFADAETFFDAMTDSITEAMRRECAVEDFDSEFQEQIYNTVFTPILPILAKRKEEVEEGMKLLKVLGVDSKKKDKKKTSGGGGGTDEGDDGDGDDDDEKEEETSTAPVKSPRRGTKSRRKRLNEALAPQDSLLLDVSGFIDEHVRTMLAAVETAAAKYAKYEAHARLATLGTVVGYLTNHHQLYLNYLENLLRQQLVAALGTRVSTDDFANYMVFHVRRVLGERLAPRAFAYAVRRVGHTPFGTVSLETDVCDQWQPLRTHHRQWAVRDAAAFMTMALSASTLVSLGGTRHMHTFVRHTFDGVAPPVRFVARARQFSAFIVVIGTIGPAGDTFEAKSAMLVRNKDEWQIALELETLPSKKEFEDHIRSLSPEQRRFCEAYRSMQLSGTLFGICVIQIQPCLERLLTLPPHALTKEIELTESLMELFIEYNVPSDLLKAPTVGEVKQCVKRIKAMIDDAQKKELEDAKKEFEKKQIEDGKLVMVDSVNSYVEDECDNLEGYSVELNEVRSMAREIDDDYGDLNSLIMIQGEKLESLDDKSADLAFQSKTFKKSSKSISLMPSFKMPSFGRRRNTASAAPEMAEAERRMSAELGMAGDVDMPMGGEGALFAGSFGVLSGKRAAAEPILPVENGRMGAKDASEPAAPQPDSTGDVLGAVLTEASTGLSEPTTISDAEQPRDDDAAIVHVDADREIRRDSDAEEVGAEASDAIKDVSIVPKQLEALFDGAESVVRPVIIKLDANEDWLKRSQAGLLSSPTDEWLSADEQRDERVRVFELLDALTRGGELALIDVDLHIVVSLSHCFERTVMNTLVMDNVNPIVVSEGIESQVSEFLHSLN